MGYKVDSIEKNYKGHLSPRFLTEQITLFYSEVTTNDQIGRGGVANEEQEDIKLVKKEVNKAIADWEAFDAKTTIALQWYALNKLN